MRDPEFSKHVARELPRWQQQGWITPEGGQAILADLAAREPARHWAALLALMGALLLGVGAITWFAAHWDALSKVFKLLLILVALGGSHVAYGLSLARADLPKLAQGLALLSVLLFGAAIMLVGQIYHIDAHFPDGIALWAAGGLLTAWLLGSQPALLAALALAALWTWFEMLEFQAMNWPLLGFLLLSARPILIREWPQAARLWGGVLLFWVLAWHAQPEFEGQGTDLAHFRLLALQMLGLAGLWAWSQAHPRPMVRTLGSDFLLAPLVGAFAFTFPDFLPGVPPDAQTHWGWLLALAVCAGLFGAGVLALSRRSTLDPRRLRLGWLLALAFVLLLGLEVLHPRTQSLSALLWNGLFLGLLFWIGDLGMRRGDRQLVNRAFAGFALWLLARYFDAFWSLMDRALFFMAGGLLLLAAGAWLERRRRALMRDLDARRQP